MGLIDLISPKWKHSNPEIRIAAIKEMGEKDLDLLQKIATTDKEARVRKRATEKISNREILEEIVKNESDREVIRTARAQLDRIYCELTLASDDPDARKLFLDEMTDEAMIASIACRVDDPELRLVAVRKISDESLLCTISESNCGAAAGDVVVDKISDQDVLYRISEKASNKKTRKKALDKLDTMVETENRPSIEKEKQTALEHILGTLEIRLTPANWEKAEVILQDAETQWKIHDPEAAHPLFTSFSSAVKTLNRQIAAYKNRCLTETSLEKLIREIQALADFPSLESRHQADTLQQKWLNIDKKNIPYTTSQDLERRFDRAVETVVIACEQQEKVQAKHAETEKRMTALTVKAEKLLAADAWEDVYKDVDPVLAVWRDIVSNAPDTSSLKDRLDHAVREIRLRHAEYCEKRENDLKDQENRLRDILEKVKGASAEEDKSLFKSAAVVKRAKSEWKEAGRNIPEIKNQLSPQFQHACDTFYTRLNEYKQNRDWELWANLTHKSELCEVIESIAASLDSETEPQEPATLVREAQEKWKTIGPVARDQSDEIWARFRKGCDEVFSRCFDRKQALYKDLTRAVQISNYSHATEKVKEIQKAWQWVGILPLSIEKDLRDTFQSECDRFFEARREFFRQRDDDRHENLKIKTALCEEAETLSTSTDWNTTAEKLKQFQQKWKETGPVPRQEGDVLWDRFQAACNMFFGNLEHVKPQNLAEKEALCDQVEKIVVGVTDDTHIESASKQVMELQRQWKEIGPVPRENIASIWDRFHTACEEVFTMRRVYHKKREEQWSKNEALKENLVAEAEALSNSEDWEHTPGRLKEIQAEWKNIPSGSRKAEQALWERLNTACDTFFARRRAVFEYRDKERQENLKKKESLCLTMELLAKLLLEGSILDYNDNIPIAEQLSRAMELRDEVVVPGEENVTRNNIIKKKKQIQAEWKEIGPVPDHYDRQLWERFQKAGNLLYFSKKE